MMKRTTTALRNQRGFTITEVLVASAIFTIIMIAALLMYDKSNKVFKSGAESADLQQNTRVAFDKMVADLRMTGFDYKRTGKVLSFGPPAWQPSTQYQAGQVVRPTTSNGFFYRCISGGTSHTAEPGWDPAPGATVPEGGGSTVQWVQSGGIEYEQPDEQVEFAGISSIVVRGNFDYETDPRRENGREYVLCVAVPCGPGVSGLERTQFPVVTTGNDEIVAFGLVSVDPTTGAPIAANNVDAITYFADVNSSGAPSRRAFPGGVAERLVTIPNVDLSNLNPPYNLVRFTLAPDGSVVSTPIAENIRSLEFTYFEDASGLQALRDNQATPAPAPNVGGVGQFDPANPTASIDGRLIRGKIRSIGVRLVGMNDTEDVNWNDTADAVAPTYRKYELQTVIVPRNIGMFGQRENEARPPDAPSLEAVCFGYCGIAVVKWTPSPTATTETYAVEWESDPSGAKGTDNAGVLTQLAVDLTQKPLERRYTFRVFANNSAGRSPASNDITVYIKNVTTPNSPSSLVASGGPLPAPPAISGSILLTWQGPTANAAGTTSCSDASTPAYVYFPRETGYWRVYRDLDPNFTADPLTTSMIFDENDAGQPIPDNIGGWIWSDTTAPTCVDYYYRIQAVEYCGLDPNYNDPADATLSVSPIYPPNGTAAIQGQASAGAKPSAPTGLAIDAAASAATCTPNSPPSANGDVCQVALNWNTVTTDINGDPKVVSTYKIVRQQRQFGVPIGAPQVETQGGYTGAGATETYTTAALPMWDGTGPISYDFYVMAFDCQNSDPSNQVTYPIPCLSNTVDTWAATGGGPGTGVASAWIVTDSDTVTVSHPTATLTSVSMDIYDSSDTFLVTLGPLVTAPFAFSWPSGMTEGETYRVLITATDNSGPPCSETFTRYAQEEVPIPTCSLTVDDPNGTILTQTGVRQLRLVLQNTDTENLNLEQVELSYLNPSRARIDTVTFPSGGANVLTGETGVYTITPATSTSGTGTAIIDVNPLPAGLIAGDAIVPPVTSIVLLVNWFQTANGSAAQTEIGLANLTKVCVKYTKSSTGTSVFSCRLHNSIGIDASPNNPGTCD